MFTYSLGQVHVRFGFWVDDRRRHARLYFRSLEWSDGGAFKSIRLNPAYRLDKVGFTPFQLKTRLRRDGLQENMASVKIEVRGVHARVFIGTPDLNRWKYLYIGRFKTLALLNFGTPRAEFEQTDALQTSVQSTVTSNEVRDVGVTDIGTTIASWGVYFSRTEWTSEDVFVIRVQVAPEFNASTDVEVQFALYTQQQPFVVYGANILRATASNPAPQPECLSVIYNDANEQYTCIQSGPSPLFTYTDLKTQGMEEVVLKLQGDGSVLLFDGELFYDTDKNEITIQSSRNDGRKIQMGSFALGSMVPGFTRIFFKGPRSSDYKFKDVLSGYEETDRSYTEPEPVPSWLYGVLGASGALWLLSAYLAYRSNKKPLVLEPMTDMYGQVYQYTDAKGNIYGLDKKKIKPQSEDVFGDDLFGDDLFGDDTYMDSGVVPMEYDGSIAEDVGGDMGGDMFMDMGDASAMGMENPDVL